MDPNNPTPLSPAAQPVAPATVVSVPEEGVSFPSPAPSTPSVPPTPAPPPPAAAAATPPPAGTVKPSKKGLPVKAIIFGLVGLVVLLVIFFVAKMFLGKGDSGPVTLTWWGLWESEAVVKPLIDEYQAANPEVQINYVYSSQREYRERLQSALSSGTGPDIFRLHNSWLPMFRSDLSPMPAEVYPASDFEAIFYPTAKTDLRIGSSYVAMPLEFDGLAMYVNEDLLAASGQSVPTSWEDLRRTAVAMSVCDSEDGKCSPGSKVLVSGAALGTADNVDHWQDIVAVLMLQNNVNLNAPSGVSAEEALQYYTIFNRSDHIWDSSLPNSTLAFAQGKVAIMFAPSWRVFDIQSLAPTLNFKTYAIPQLPLDASRGEKPITWASYWVEGVNKKSVNAAIAWDFLKFLSTPESLQKLYGNAVASGRLFGEPYPRTDMASTLSTAPYVGAYINQAPQAKSWYMASATWDGQTGINSRLSQYFADAINGINQGKGAPEVVKTLSAGINQVLSQYGLSTALPPAQ